MCIACYETNSVGCHKQTAAPAAAAPTGHSDFVLGLQRAHGNAQFSRMIAGVPSASPRLQRFPMWSPIAAAQSQAEPEPEGPSDKEVVAEAKEELIDLLVGAATEFVGVEGDAKNKPPSSGIKYVLSRRLIKYKPPDKGAAKSPLAPLWEALYGAEADAIIKKLDGHSTVGKGSKRKKSKTEQKKHRMEVLHTVLERLLPSSEEGAEIDVPGERTDPAEQAAIERPLITGKLRDLLTEDGKWIWPEVRTSVLVSFGALGDGPRAAIARANDYYDNKLVKGRLFGVDLHGGSVVHPDLQKAFDKATAFVDDESQKKLRKTAATGFSTKIRPNQNAKHQLSDHSFGWAVDLRTELNPNAGKQGALDPVAAVTGTDPRKYVMNSKKSKSMSSAEMSKLAEELKRISDDYTIKMSGPTTLKPVLREIANDARGAADLPALGEAAERDLLAAATEANAKQRAAALRPVVWPEGAATPKAKPPKPVAAAIKTLSMVGNAYLDSIETERERKNREKRAKQGKKPMRSKVAGRADPESEGNPGSVAAYGFTSLEPALVAALAGNDEGGLQWLGTASVQDYMHFQLYDPPDLPTTGAPPADTAHASAG